MINFYVGGNPAAVKKGTQVEYVLENPLFEGSDGYSMSVEFPMLGCPENIRAFGGKRLNRADVVKSADYIPACVAMGGMLRCGSLALLETGPEAVKGQFLEGVSPDGKDYKSNTIRLHDLKTLGRYPVEEAKDITVVNAQKGTADEVCMPWVVEGYDVVNNNAVRDFTGTYSAMWHEETKYLSWMPYLVTMMKRVAKEAGYSLDITRLAPHWSKAIICNALPGVWRKPNYVDALPDWSVREFFEYLAPVLGGIFQFDESAAAIKYDTYESAVCEAGITVIDNVDDDYTATIAKEEGNTDFIPAKNFRYQRTDNPIWNFYDNPAFVQKMNGPYFKSYKTWQEYQDAIAIKIVEGKRTADTVSLAYIEEWDTYFVTRKSVIYTAGHMKKESSDKWPYTAMMIDTPVNNLGPRKFDKEKPIEYSELKVNPVAVDYALEGLVFWLPMSGYSEDKDTVHEIGELPTSWGQSGKASNGFRLYSTLEGALEGHSRGTYATLDNDETKEVQTYYDALYLGFREETQSLGYYTPYVDIQSDCSDMPRINFRYMRLSGPPALRGATVDPAITYKFKFTVRDIPDVRSRFAIHGQLYICRNMTVTFTDEGRDPIVRGEFLKLIYP